ncbi:putative J domain-containing protein [Seiridium unicorne]|uniref:J domain-containing protein n=1 Tax=Seiridium unicorne TaxID=138068 RepID=A0ABR2V353_9PEZI
MDKSELLAFAREYSSKNIDLYDLLGIDSLKATEANEIKRAYRKQSIKYHPDKLGDAFDPDKWQLLERGRDVLMDKDAKDAYDAARGAALREQERRKAMDAKRKAAIEDLEARERGEVPKRLRKEDDNNGMTAAERQRLYQEGSRRVEMRKRQMAEAEERERKAQELVNSSQKPKNDTEAPNLSGSNLPEQQSTKSDEEDDPEIAAIQRRIREAQEKKAAKAARKAEKATRKGGEKLPPSDIGSQAQEPPIPSHTTETQADEKKKVPKFSFTTPSSTSSTTAPKGDWASIKERLKVAQAEREKRKAEAT